MVKYPNVSVKLVGEDGNAFSILGRVSSALRNAGASKEERDLFQKEATSGDYSHLLGVVMDWVNCDEEDEIEDEDLCEDCCKPFDDCTCDDYYEDEWESDEDSEDEDE